MRILKFFIFPFLLFFAASCAGGPSGILPDDLRCEYMSQPLAVDIPAPRLSWINAAIEGEKGQRQTAWQVQAASSPEKLAADEADLWDSGKVRGDRSSLVEYTGKELSPTQQCWWRVRVWDRGGNASQWSDIARWGMGLMGTGNWQGEWIGAPWQDDEPLPRSGEFAPPPAPMLRKSFRVGKEIKSAMVYATGLGYFELYLNGDKVGDDVLVPNQTNYDKRPGLENFGIPVPDEFTQYKVLYLGYDVTHMLRQDENVLGTMLGNGFYNAGSSHWTMPYGSPRFICELHITYADDSREIVQSDRNWLAAKGPLVMDGIYQGERYDARLEKDGWNAPGFDTSGWEPAAPRRAPYGELTGHISPPDRVMERLAARKIERLGEGHYKIDYGEEISGWIGMQDVTAPGGHTVEINYINESAPGRSSYTFRGGRPESNSARFTWYVFREAEVKGWPGELTAEQLVAEAVYTDVETSGHFECSNELFNKINRIWWRSQTDNMHGGVASDCPHRERSAYTGDGQVACVTVMHNLDAAAFYTKWIDDMRGAQLPTGYVPNGAPWQPGCGGGVAWGAAMNVMPWEFYLHYGDKGMLERNYAAMKAQVDYMTTWITAEGTMKANAPLDREPVYWMNLGDWCPPYVLPPDEMVHTFYLWRCADFTARAAEVLGNSADRDKYAGLAGRTAEAFHLKFYDPVSGSYGKYGGNVFALRMGVPAKSKDKVLAALRNDIAENGGHLDTGIYGTQFFFEILAENGMNELAFEAMNKRDFPSYGRWIEQGATTTWEEWNGNNSRNHPMFGGGLVWFYRKLAGMQADPASPGYKHIIFRPQPAGDVTWVSYGNRTPYGNAGIEWSRRNEAFEMEVMVPVGATATVYVPVPAEDAKPEISDKKYVKERGLTDDGFGNHYRQYDIAGSGIYSFRY